MVQPAGCRDASCAVEFEGEPVTMAWMSVTYWLREDITWADGEAVMADDSVFAYQVASDPATPGWQDLVARTSSYVALDDWHVKWVGIPGYIDADYAETFFPPLPRHQLADYTAAELVQADVTRRTPLGWGPFVVDDWVTGEYLALAPNLRYYRAGEGMPYLDRLVFRFAADVPDLTARLLAGECDVGVGGDYEAYEPLMPMLVQAEREGVLRVISSTGDTWEQLDFGIDPASPFLRADFFDDVRVRQAVALCLDRQAIVDEVTYGRSVVPTAYLPPGHPLYADDEGLYWTWPYNPAFGQALLEEVGWLDQDGDSVREAEGVEGIRDGEPFEVELLVSADDPEAEIVGRIIRTNLADCGIRVTLNLVAESELLADGPDGPLYGRRFDLAETTRRFDGLPGCGDYLTSQIPVSRDWVGENAAGYSSADYDSACQAAVGELPGAPEYDYHHHQAQVIFSEQLPAIPLFAWLRVALARPGVTGFDLDPSSPSPLWNVEEIDVE